MFTKSKQPTKPEMRLMVELLEELTLKIADQAYSNAIEEVAKIKKLDANKLRLLTIESRYKVRQEIKDSLAHVFGDWMDEKGMN